MTSNKSNPCKGQAICRAKAWPQLFKRWITLSSGYITILWIVYLVSLILIRWIVIYPVDSAIQLLNNCGLVDWTRELPPCKPVAAHSDDLSASSHNPALGMQECLTKLWDICVACGWHSSALLTEPILLQLFILFLLLGFGDLEFSALSYIYALASVVCQSFYLTYIQKTGVEKGFCTLTVLHTNCVNCIPVLFLYTIFNNELLAAFRFDGYDTLAFQVSFFIVETLTL